MNINVGRIIDANLNRAREGLRVAEEVARMILEHQALQKKIKALRHQLILIEKKIPPKTLIEQRSVKDDPGAKNTHPNESKRYSIKELAQSNLRRCQEACRVLEEFSKLDNAAISRAFKKVRFQSYDLERELIKQIDRQDKDCHKK